MSASGYYENNIIRIIMLGKQIIRLWISRMASMCYRKGWAKGIAEG
jgi:hypothetical protein